jgi:hypothetical protein
LNGDWSEQVNQAADPDDDVEAHVYSQASEVELDLEVIAGGLLAPLPALNLNEVRERCSAVDPPPWGVSGEADWADGVLLSSTQRSLSMTGAAVDDLVARLRVSTTC